MSYYFMLILSKIACLMPWKLCEKFGNLLGNFAWIFVPSRRKNLARENIKRCLHVDDAEANRIAKLSSTRFGAMFFEFLRFPLLKTRMKDHVEIENLEYLLEYKKSTDIGAIIATCHSDNWELMGGAFACNGIPLVGVAKKQRSMDRFINEYRTLIGMHITYKTGVREMFDMLGEGWFIGLIMDQDPSRRDGVVVNFFDQPTNTPVGAASMARFKDVPIFPAFMHRKSDGTHQLIVYPPIRVEKTKDKREDIKRTTQLLSDFIEEHVRNFPEEWFWLHDRWKSMREEF